MRIAYIAVSEIPSFKANSIQVMKVCQAMAQNGEDVQLFIPGSSTRDWKALEEHYGIRELFKIFWVKYSPVFRKLDFSLHALLLTKKNKADLVYTRVMWVARMAQILGLPVILEMHDLPSGRFAPAVYQAYLRSSKPCLTVFITRALQQQSEVHFGKPLIDNRSLVAPDGVDIERYNDLPDSRKARSILGLADKTTAVYTGGFYEGRGLEILFNLAKMFPGAQFLWVGGTQEQVAGWREKLAEAGILNVILPGFIANKSLPLYQSAADILLMPYSKKVSGSSGGNIASVSSPMKMFEYMAAGRIILASDLPVLREVLDETNAIFYPPEDFESLCSVFKQVTIDPAQFSHLAQKCKLDVLNYSWKTRMKKIISSALELLR